LEAQSPEFKSQSHEEEGGGRGGGEEGKKEKGREGGREGRKKQATWAAQLSSFCVSEIFLGSGKDWQGEGWSVSLIWSQWGGD
jgi:hypothetical protein